MTNDALRSIENQSCSNCEHRSTKYTIINHRQKLYCYKPTEKMKDRYVEKSDWCKNYERGHIY